MIFKSLKVYKIASYGKLIDRTNYRTEQLTDRTIYRPDNLSTGLFADKHDRHVK